MSSFPIPLDSVTVTLAACVALAVFFVWLGFRKYPTDPSDGLGYRLPGDIEAERDARRWARFFLGAGLVFFGAGAYLATLL